MPSEQRVQEMLQCAFEARRRSNRGTELDFSIGNCSSTVGPRSLGTSNCAAQLETVREGGGRCLEATNSALRSNNVRVNPNLLSNLGLFQTYVKPQELFEVFADIKVEF